jgi:hypothetical protein
MSELPVDKKLQVARSSMKLSMATKPADPSSTESKKYIVYVSWVMNKNTVHKPTLSFSRHTVRNLSELFALRPTALACVDIDTDNDLFPNSDRPLDDRHAYVFIDPK